MADLAAAAADLRPGVGDAEPDPTRLPGSGQLVTALSEAAGVPVTLASSTADYRRRAAQETGWLPLLLWRRLRPDPLGRLGLDRDDEAGLRALSVESAPPAGQAQRDRVELAVHELTSGSAAQLPVSWAEAVRSATVAGGGELSDAIDEAVREVDLTLRRPVWWGALRIAQIVLLGISAVGLVWWLLGLVAGVPSPSIGGAGLAGLMLVDGIGLGAVLAVASRWFVHTGAQRRGARVGAQLRAVVNAVAVERVIAPVAAVVIDHRTVRQALDAAR
jgi:hypothetical protein